MKALTKRLYYNNDDFTATLNVKRDLIEVKITNVNKQLIDSFKTTMGCYPNITIDLPFCINWGKENIVYTGQLNKFMNTGEFDIKICDSQLPYDFIKLTKHKIESGFSMLLPNNDDYEANFSFMLSALEYNFIKDIFTALLNKTVLKQ